MTFGYVKVLVCFHYLFLYVSSQGEDEEAPPERKKVVVASCQKEYWVGEVEIVSKPIYNNFFLCV